MKIRQSRSFKRKVKKFREQEKKILNKHIQTILDNPNIGHRKRGDLREVSVYKFKIHAIQYLLSYRFVDGELELITIGSHENYYRDLKKYASNGDGSFLTRRGKSAYLKDKITCCGGRMKKDEHNISVTGKVRFNQAEKIIAARMIFTNKLDILGSIGIVRSFIFAGQFGQNVFENGASETSLAQNTSENGRVKESKEHSPLIEYEIKFKKIPERLYIRKAKEITIERLVRPQKA